MTHSSPIPPDTLAEMARSRKVRVAITRDSFWYFFHLHLAHYVTCPTAPFQRELIQLAEDEAAGNLHVVAFRGSGKSTILTTAYPLWAIFGRQQKKFVLILCQTQGQAKQHMANIRRELEGNPVLRGDFGPFQEEGGGEWGSSSLVFSKLGARVTAASSEQSIRGLRHNQHRPDLIVCDDVEDMASAKTREGRQKVHQWLTGEVVPAGDPGTRLVVVGNLLHEDSLLMRIKRDIAGGTLSGQFREYPLVDPGTSRILWPGKYPDAAAVEAERKRVGSDVAWQREYLLRIVPDEDQAIDPSWITYYDALPTTREPRAVLIGVDLAISQRDTADCTAIVAAYVYGHEEGFRVYVLPQPTNERLSFPATIDRLRALHGRHRDVAGTEVLIEDVGYQRAVVEQLAQTGVPAEGVRVPGDKRSRLVTISSLLQSGKIRFPRVGCERLLEQVLGFGVERHDDLVDALTIVGHRAIELDKPVGRISFIYSDGSDDETIELGDTDNDY